MTLRSVGCCWQVADLLSLATQTEQTEFHLLRLALDPLKLTYWSFWTVEVLVGLFKGDEYTVSCVLVKGKYKWNDCPLELISVLITRNSIILRYTNWTLILSYSRNIRNMSKLIFVSLQSLNHPWSICNNAGVWKFKFGIWSQLKEEWNRVVFFSYVTNSVVGGLKFPLSYSREKVFYVYNEWAWSWCNTHPGPTISQDLQAWIIEGD